METVVFTGGHHTGALEVAVILRRQGIHIVWFGHRHSMWGDTSDSAEYRQVTAAGIPFYDLLAGKFYRTFHPLKLIRIPFGFLQAFYYLLLVKPVGIVSFGGYLAVPTVIIGWLLGIPSITHEQTAVPGWANRAISVFVRKIALTWPESARHYPKHKTVVTGLPLRPEIIKLKNLKPGTRNLKPVIYFTGGKQGSHVINTVVASALPALLQKYRLIHQTGSSTLYNDYRRTLPLSRPGYEVFDFDSQKAVSALERADVVVSRGGAHIVYELGFLGKRSVIVPIPWASHDEQTKNAAILERNILAVILPQSDLTPASLLTSIQRARLLTGLPLPLPPDAADRMVRLIKQELRAHA